MTCSPPYAPDVVVEATGAGRLVFDAMRGTAAYGIVCLTGVSPAGRSLTVDAGTVNRDIVLENDVVVGSVNANLRHFGRPPTPWHERTGRAPPAPQPPGAADHATRAFEPGADDIKTVITLEGGAD
ncbi:hypothetical protein LV779_07215 [Streptomyces thinghirensis]|nr:hypothetical protein [Streptomyces thinghirensis]